MNKLNVISFLAALTFAACTSVPKSYIVEGVVPDDSYNNQMLYMYDHQTGKIRDSSLIVDRKFKFTGSVDNVTICQFTLPRLMADFILENGKISVDMVVTNCAKGTPLNDGLSKFRAEAEVFAEEFNKKTALLMQNQDIDEKTRGTQIDEHLKLCVKKIDSLSTVIFHANKNNVLGAYVLSQWTDFSDPDLLNSLYAQAGDVVRNYKPLQRLIEINAIKIRTAVGMPFIDFTIEKGNKDGSKASLSDYVGKGKYVLVDFWASWCGPCIEEIPLLMEVYNKYKGDKFEMLGVAVMEQREESLKSLEKHNIPWSQIIDAGDIPTKLYGISGIPYIILFAPDGTIVARDLRGDFLKAKVAEVMQ